MYSVKVREAWKNSVAGVLHERFNYTKKGALIAASKITYTDKVINNNTITEIAETINLRRKFPDSSRMSLKELYK